MVMSPIAEQQTEHDPSKAPPWDARCSACGGWIATAPGEAPWVRAKCMNWRVTRTVGSDRKCRLYNQSQMVHRR